ncbi:Structural maintenance of chromosomes protein 1 [Malassezia vespertilionis]|uniref:Structural maintenance of chromosomes protein n=1 Tax=Malassezia vespertilionis TaxID=2020962 RepID=A0A2N1J9F9_9BASI|nr:Structural maintenance of chromosomes protein 1 [Malassezia vespertilionis]PKI83176.1 Smc1p [Malassezia vespertilionis]WFD07882.1 Structural maintenance of chromosomes protein 1 [Malassezia vespertilionis]
MPLSVLEIDNFKSYRGKHVIGPFHAFSAVIGPNGSGKSNVMDAISFVLGIRSAQLRSTQLRDLVYRASNLALEPASSQDPSRASVTAVILDAKRVEHKFQRIITPTGSSEYKYDGRGVSYAQYAERLERLNVLVKARNFLVFQGDVEAIANQCSKDLSHVIDQVSGAHAVEADLEEARGAYDDAVAASSALIAKRKSVMSEVRQYRQQKEASDRLDQLKSGLHAHIVQKVLWRLYHIHEIIEIHTDWIEAHASRGEQLRKRVQDREDGVASARTEAGVIQQQIMAKEKEAKHSARLLDARRPEKERLLERIEHAQQKLAQARVLYAQAQKDEQCQKEALARLAADIALAERAVEEARANDSVESIHLSAADLQAYHDLRARADLSVTEERRTVEKGQRALRQMHVALENRGESVEQLETKLDRIEQQSASVASSLASLQQRTPALEEGVTSVRASLDAVRTKKQALSTREAHVNEALVTCYNQLLQMGQDQRVHERETRLREALRSMRNVFPGVHGRLLDLCTPTQRKYALALATTLGRNADAVVVGTEKTAMECIEYLRNQRAGRATFIPLDTIHSKPVQDRLRAVSLHARLAIDVVQYAPAIERAVQFACASTMICDSLDVARELAYGEKKIKTVTLQGTIIHKNGMMTGGPSMQDSAKRWDEREMEGAQRERDRCMQALKSLHQQKYELADEEELLAKLARREAALDAARQETADLTRRQAELQTERASLETERSAQRTAYAAAKKEAQALEAEMAALEQQIHVADDAVFGEFCARIGVENVRAYEAQQLHLFQARTHAAQQHERQLARLGHQRTFAVQQLDSTAERLAFLQAAIDKETQRIPRLETEIGAFDAAMAASNAARDDVQASFERLRDAYQAATAALQDKRKALLAASREMDAHRKQVADRNDEIEQLDAERTALYRRCRLEAIDVPLLAGDMAHVPLDEEFGAPLVERRERDTALHCREYGIEVDFSRLTDAERSDRGSGKARELQSNVDAVREEMERIAPGAKSVGRLGMLERDLKACERDMDAAREQVRDARQAFVALKKRRIELFMNAYTHIAERIDGVYKELTRSSAAPMGGVAYLTLEDTDEPYRTGIRYHAMPPMKRFRDMDQLSGGEKTVAALALLFAIHTYHPAPFFVLDEVDAALDAQNVVRVAEYIRAHASEQLQFIVISLKASMYERSQALLGVYRNQEANSSKSVTMDLEQYGT